MPRAGTAGEEALRCGGATDVAKRAEGAGSGKGVRRVPERAGRARFLLKRLRGFAQFDAMRDGIGDETAWLTR